MTHPTCDLHSGRLRSWSGWVRWVVVIAPLLATCAGVESTDPRLEPREALRMATIHIDFQTGFDDDTVLIHLDGREVHRSEGLSTKLLYGLAESAAIEVVQGSIEIEFTLERRGLSHARRLTVQDDLYLGLSIVDGEIQSIVQDGPFGYG